MAFIKHISLVKIKKVKVNQHASSSLRDDEKAISSTQTGAVPCVQGLRIEDGELHATIRGHQSSIK